MMRNKTIKKIVDNGLCSACGICAAVCPKKSIQLIRDGIELVPEIDDKSCVACGLCLNVCSVSQIGNCISQTSIEKYLVGEYKELLCVQARNKKILEKTTSGGFITQVVQELIKSKTYSSAFLVKGKATTEVLCAEHITNPDEVVECARSKYLTISQEKSVSYIMEHPSEKVILVGCGCAIQTILNIISKCKLKRENYLLIGLFCDKTMNYGVIDYFMQHPAAHKKELSDVLFRTKSAGGWPGNLRLEFADGTYVDLPIEERGKIKDYFMPERCLYCTDKLNKQCDISVGDNYIKTNADPEGVSSVIIRTEIGVAVWEKVRHLFDYHKDKEEDLIESQVLHEKKNNYLFGFEKGLYSSENQMIPNSVIRLYHEHLRKIDIAKKNKTYKSVHGDIVLQSVKKKIFSIAKFPFRFARKLLRRKGG